MPYIPFILLSAPEYIAVLLLICSLFRIKSQGFYPHILFIAFILGNVSYATRADEVMAAWSPSFQMAVAIVCMWLLFRIPLFYASIVYTFANVAYGLSQLIILTVYLELGIVDFEEVSSSSLIGYIVPLSSILLTIAGIIIIRKYNLSIEWIPNNPKARVPMNRENILFLILLIIINVCYTTMFIWWFGGLRFLLLVVTIILTILFLCLMYLSRKRDSI